MAPEDTEALGHSWSEWAITEEATCTEAGSKERECSVCHEKETAAIEAAGHSEEEIPAVAATCTEGGKTAGTKCSVCGEILVAPEDTEALGHSWSEWIVTKEATEEEEGLKTRECSRDPSHTETQTIAMLDHSHVLDQIEYVAPTCTESGNIKYWVCSKCGKIFSDSEGGEEITEIDTIIPATDHVWDEGFTIDKEPSCTEKGSMSRHCANCDAKLETIEIPTVEHTYSEWAITEEATCTEAGSKEREFSVCHEKETETITALGHEYETGFTVDRYPSCTEDGLESRHCIRCDATTDSRTIHSTGHSFGAWEEIAHSTCVNHGIEQRTCSACGVTETKDTDLADHDWEDELKVDVEPTCTEDGSKSRHCRNCDAVTDSVSIPLLGHKYSDWTVVKAATCTEAGSKEKVCVVCGDKTTEEILMLGHAWNEVPTVDKPATCTEEGTQSTHCARCNETRNTSVIPVKGHQWNTIYTIDIPATEYAAGSQSIHCSVCNTVKEGSTQTIAQLPPSEIIDLPAVKISKPKAAKKKATVKWKKVSKSNQKKIQGIQIQIATDSGFTNIVKVGTAGKKKASKTFKGLQSKTTYYVRIRAYATGNHYSVWKYKTVKVK